MADFQTFEVDTKLAPINVGPWNWISIATTEYYLLLACSVVNVLRDYKSSVQGSRNGCWMYFNVDSVQTLNVTRVLETVT
jgi:hypothetical protein